MGAFEGGLEKEFYDFPLVNELIEISPQQLQVVAAIDQAYQAITSGSKVSIIGITPNDHRHAYYKQRNKQFKENLRVATARDVILDMIEENKRGSEKFLSYTTPVNVPEGIIVGPYGMTILVRPELNPVFQKLCGARPSKIPPSSEFLHGSTQYPRITPEQRRRADYEPISLVTAEEFDALYEQAKAEENLEFHLRTAMLSIRKLVIYDGEPLPIWEYTRGGRVPFADFLLREPAAPLFEQMIRKGQTVSEDKLSPLERGLTFKGLYYPDDINLHAIKKEHLNQMRDNPLTRETHGKFIDLDFDMGKYVKGYVGVAGMIVIVGTNIGINPYGNSFHGRGMRAQRTILK